MIATILLSAVLLYWIAQAMGAVQLVRHLSVLDDVPLPERDAWPRLSIIIPARDEAHTLEAALRSKLAEGYPNIELVVVDDRSTDATGEIADRLAASDPRIRAVHVTSLPEGWLGKLHALQRGLEASTGEWVLFSDADIHFTAGALSRAIAHCDTRGLDHLGVFPAIWPSSFWIDVTLAGFTRVTALTGRMWRVEDPRSKAAGGVGAFNLVRRAALERTPGLEWLKMEVGDDVALGQMLKRSGARSAIVNGRGQAVQGVRVALQRGLYWRGTFYPAEQLLAGHRLELR